MLTFYFAPGSSSMAAHIALREVGAEFAAIPLSFHTGEMKTPAYLALNPEGLVPLLLIDGRRLTEVAAILYYLARSYPEAKLLPLGDIEAEARVISWMSFTASALHPARFLPTDKAHAVWKVAETRLAEAGGVWALGAAYSIADIHLFRLFWRFQPVLGLHAGDYPTLFAHRARMLERPAVQAVLKTESDIGYQLP
jgi:glutathione S-transferase